MLSDIERTQIFLSYPHNARNEARHLGEFLKDVGFKVSYEKEIFGKEWEDEEAMRISISNADFVLLCMVKESFINYLYDLNVNKPLKRRELFKKEKRHALKICHAKSSPNIFLITCRFEKCMIPSKFEKMPFVDLFESNGYEELVDLLKKGMEQQGRIFTPHIRSKSRNDLSIYDAMRLIRIKGFFNKEWNGNIDGFDNDCEFEVRQGEKIIIEKVTGRIWQRYTSNKFMEADGAIEHIEHLNKVEFAGYKDWRLPSLDEALTLMKKQTEKDFYIHPGVHDRQNWILTADKDDNASWIVNHNTGFCRIGFAVDGICVRAVRFDEKCVST